MKKKFHYVICALVIFSLVVVCSYGFYKEDLSVSYAHEISVPDYVSIYLEDSSGEYVESNLDIVPAAMVFNNDLSYCINGSLINYDDVLYKLSLNTKGSDVCYVYFDLNREDGAIKSINDAIYLSNNTSYSEVKNKGDANYSSTDGSGLYAIEDDYTYTTGVDSVYYRGSVSNNYLTIGDMVFRIVRINGDGSVRLISQESVGDSSINSLSNSAEYTGYMYSVGDSHGSSVSSNIKSSLDSWYVTNILNSSFVSNIKDSVYCIDREAYVTNSVNNIGEVSTSSGVGSDNVYFAANIRNSEVVVPSLKCSNRADAFSVDDTLNGNAALTYPVGLLSVDEAVVAGFNVGSASSSNYLVNGDNFWLSSPANFVDGIANGYVVSSSGVISTKSISSSGYKSRVVINLNKGTLVSGSGISIDPFVVE